MTTQRGGMGPGAGLAFWLRGAETRKEFDKYRSAGGHLDYIQWLKQGKPQPLGALTMRGKKGFGETVRELPIEEQQWMMQQEVAPKLEEAREKEEAAAKEDVFEKKGREKEEREEKWKEREFAEKKRQFDESQRIKTYTAFGINPFGVPDNPETPWVEGWNPYTGQWEAPPGWISPEAQGRLDLLEKQEEQRRIERGEDIAWRREEAGMRRAEQERQYKAQLLASPMSWLAFHSYEGSTPISQWWMKPLMAGQYQENQPLQGWSPNVREGQPMTSLSELRTPSAQLWGRMGPTAQQQYMGYEQTRSGIRPEETAFRLRATAPPSGRFGGLRRMR